ncbi:MAG: hypothetical protein SCH68_12090 [Brevefilum sp.]|nr:hypothetical protein [Brevefilum sp.]
MELKNEFDHLESENFVDKKMWVTPEIEVYDIVEMTQAGDYTEDTPLDNTFGYS